MAIYIIYNQGYAVDGSTFWLQILNKGFDSSISLLIKINYD
jgi:hypothetical protein